MKAGYMRRAQSGEPVTARRFHRRADTAVQRMIDVTPRQTAQRDQVRQLWSDGRHASTGDDVIQRVGNGEYDQASGSVERVEDDTKRKLDESSSLDIARHSMAHARGVAYVVNSIVSYRDLASLGHVVNAIVNGLHHEDGRRLAIVIGVNAPENEQADMMRAIEDPAIVAFIEQVPFPVALVPQTFKGGSFPYGAMRNQVLHSAETRRLTEYFLRLGLHPYVSIQDFDVGSRRVGSADGPHVFHAIDEMLAPEREEHAGRSTDPAIAFLPLMITGGYRAVRNDLLRLRTRSHLENERVSVSDKDLDAHLGEFVKEIERDMVHRARFARLAPLLPYPPEPNLFLDAAAVLRGSPYGNRLEFGSGSAESTKLAKNVSRFAADELESYFKARLDSADRDLPLGGDPSQPLKRRRLREETENLLLIMAQNNRHPVREVTVMADYLGLNVETDLSRIAASSLRAPRAAQSHAGLGTGVDRFYDTKDDKRGSQASEARRAFRRRFEPYPAHQLDPLDPGLRPGRFGLGGKMSSALSTPFTPAGPFGSMHFGVPPSRQKEFLFQVAIDQDRQEYMDAQLDIQAQWRQGLRDDGLPLHVAQEIRLRLEHWTPADGDCGIYALGYLMGDRSLTRSQLEGRLRERGTEAATRAADGIGGQNWSLWLSDNQIADIARSLGMDDIAIVTLNLFTNTWGVMHGDPTTSAHIVGAVPASFGGPINHWVVLKRG